MKAMTKTCEICSTDFEASNGNQKYCTDCGKDPAKARKQLMRAEIRSKYNAGDRYKVREYTCKVCGRKTLSTYNRTFCSDACLQLHIVNTAKCPVCGVLLVSRGRMTGKGCCSDECRDIQRLQIAKASGRYRPCLQCGEMFIAPQDGSKFCGKPCYLAWVAEQKLKRAEKVEPEHVYEKRCKGCGKVFTYTKNNASKQYCSAECRVARVKAGVKAKMAQEQKQDKHLCTTCKTTQAHCERFTSNFVYLPKGAVQKRIKHKLAIVSCPKFS